MLYIPLFAPMALGLVTADRFAALPPLPWDARCVVVGASAAPSVVCEAMLAPAAMPATGGAAQGATKPRKAN
jgi:hypothetical protein